MFQPDALVHFTKAVLVHPFQIIGHFGFIRSIDVIMHLNIHYVYMHNSIDESRKPKMTYNLERREYLAVKRSDQSLNP
jgi:hypothetical protein